MQILSESVMKNSVSIIFFLLLFCQILAQKTLMVEKIGTTRRYFFKEEDYCKIRAARPDTMIAGKLWDIGANSITISSMRPYQVRLQDITSVYKKFYFPTKFGRLIGIGGVGIFAIITINHLINNEQVFTPDMFIISGSMLALSAISLSLSEKRCRIGNSWKVKILDIRIR
ncbi:MAG: hypothetical protein NT004_09990 [Bacteroidetes bacterium]|nr:hypothetical protein [Bacteroidota bacterium]